MSTRTAPQDLVFPGAIEGKPYSKETVIAHFRDAIREAGIDDRRQELGIALVPSHLFDQRQRTGRRLRATSPALDLGSALRRSKWPSRYDHPTHEQLLRRAAKRRRSATVGLSGREAESHPTTDLRSADTGAGWILYPSNCSSSISALSATNADGFSPTDRRRRRKLRKPLKYVRGALFVRGDRRSHPLLFVVCKNPQRLGRAALVVSDFLANIALSSIAKIDRTLHGVAS